MLAAAVASLLHHVHNAELLDQYPNMPAWISRLVVYAAWAATTLAGIAGYVFLERGHLALGLILLSAYCAYGLSSLAHYVLAPPAAHTFAMNVSIGLEAAGAAILLLCVLITGVTFRRR